MSTKHLQRTVKEGSAQERIIFIHFSSSAAAATDSAADLSGSTNSCRPLSPSPTMWECGFQPRFFLSFFTSLSFFFFFNSLKEEEEVEEEEGVEETQVELDAVVEELPS